MLMPVYLALKTPQESMEFLSHSWSILSIVHICLLYDLLVSDGVHHDF